MERTEENSRVAIILFWDVGFYFQFVKKKKITL